MGRRRRRLRDVVVIAVGLAAGIAAPSIASQIQDRLNNQTPSTISAADRAGNVDRAATPALPDVAIDPNAETVAPTPAPTPTEAVERFLKAESESDHAASFALLVNADRALYRSPAAWRAAHATIFPVLSYETRGVDASKPLVLADVRYRSTIDEVVGVVPARASVSWPTAEEHGGWLVNFSKAEVTAELPPEAGAATAADKWATQRQRCTKAEEYSAGLVGRAPLADELCRSRGAASVGPVARLDASDATPFVSAFGPSVTALARTVELSGPVPMTVVLAPVDDRWLVIGVLDPR